jgi:hypothetical protein
LSSIERILKAVREVMLLTSDVEKMADDVKLLAREVREHERRLIRIETMIEVARGAMPPAATALEAPRRRRKVAEEPSGWDAGAEQPPLGTAHNDPGPNRD